MRKRRNLPGQLALNFEGNGGYLGWLELKMEQDDEFEKATQKLMVAPEHAGVESLIWHELFTH